MELGNIMREGATPKSFFMNRGTGGLILARPITFIPFGNKTTLSIFNRDLWANLLKFDHKGLKIL